MAAFTVFSWVALLAVVVHANGNTSLMKRPDFVMIMTDDQDLHLDSLQYQPAVQKYFAAGGTFFKKHFCTMAQCFPSRVSLWTGTADHNTNVTDIQPPFGMVIATEEEFNQFRSQVATQNLFGKDIMVAIFLFGCSRPDTTPIILGSS